ncbi:hypothetical protein GQ600_13335 [Phytophthora cactorum]|nr:hypothetical protein GQ600_13335 [Phytophthora cactorum]
MAKIEEVAEHGGSGRWKAQRLVQKLDGDIHLLKVALNELDAVKPKKTTYTKKANVFFLEKRDIIVKTKKSKLVVVCCLLFVALPSFSQQHLPTTVCRDAADELKEKEKKRHVVGLELRDSSQ